MSKIVIKNEQLNTPHFANFYSVCVCVCVRAPLKSIFHLYIQYVRFYLASQCLLSRIGINQPTFIKFLGSTYIYIGNISYKFQLIT